MDCILNKNKISIIIINNKQINFPTLKMPPLHCTSKLNNNIICVYPLIIG